MAESKIPILSFKEVAAIEAYMIRESAESNGFWLKLSKIGAPETTISKDEAIEAALCCGCIAQYVDMLARGETIHPQKSAKVRPRGMSRSDAEGR
jgi:hypothetical protein